MKTQPRTRRASAIYKKLSALPDSDLSDAFRKIGEDHIAMRLGKETVFETREQLEKMAADVLDEVLARPDIRMSGLGVGALDLIRKLGRDADLSALVQQNPHGRFIAKGRKRAVVSDQLLNLSEPVIVANVHERAYGIARFGKAEEIGPSQFDSAFELHRVTKDERQNWWPGQNKFWMYKLLDFVPYSAPVRVKFEDRTALITKVEFEKETRTENIIAAAKDLPAEMVVCPEFVSISGSALWAEDRQPRDMDIVIRAPQVESGLWLKISRVFKEIFDLECHAVPCPTGSSFRNLPVYDLVLRRRPQLSIQDVGEPEVAALIYKQAQAEPAKIAAARANLRDSVPEAGRCEFCPFYIGEESGGPGCRIVDGPIRPDTVCDWIGAVDSSQTMWITPPEELPAMAVGLMAVQPGEIKILDHAFTPEGWQLLVQDNSAGKHRRSIALEAFFAWVANSFRWTEDEANAVIARGAAMLSKFEKRAAPPVGPKTAALVVVGDGPDEDEAASGVIFSGAGGRFLKDKITELGADVADIYFANVFETAEQKEAGTEVEARGAELLKTIEAMSGVKAVLALGSVAIQALTGTGDSVIEEARGMTLTTPEKKIRIFATWAPSAILRMGAKNSADFENWRSDIRAALFAASLIAKTQGSIVVPVEIISRSEPDAGVYKYQFGILPDGTNQVGGVRIDGLLPMGSTFETTENLAPGTQALVKTEGVELTKGDAGRSVVFSAPTFISADNISKLPTLTQLIKFARGAGILIGDGAQFSKIEAGDELPFVFQRQRWEGPVMVSGRTRKEMWCLRFDAGLPVPVSYIMMADPTTAAETEAELQPDVDASAMQIEIGPEQVLEPGTKLNPANRTKSWIETLDRGTATVIEDGPDVKQFEMKGIAGKITGIYIFSKEPGSPTFWKLTISTERAVKREANVEKIKIERVCNFRKVDDDKRLVYGVVYEPGVVDSQGDYMTAETIEKMAHDFMAEYQKINLMHESGIDEAGYRIVESFIAPAAFGNGASFITKGSWVMVTKIMDDEIWRLVKEGVLGGYSIEGTATEAAA